SFQGGANREAEGARSAKSVRMASLPIEPRVRGSSARLRAEVPRTRGSRGVRAATGACESDLHPQTSNRQTSVWLGTADPIAPSEPSRNTRAPGAAAYGATTLWLTPLLVTRPNGLAAASRATNCANVR